MSDAFLGWASQIQFEVFHLLKDRSTTWLNDVAGQIRDVLEPGLKGDDDYQHLLLQPNPSRTSDVPFPYLVSKAGQLGIFAAREPRHGWDSLAPATAKWERYAVFAALSIGTAFDRIDDSSRGTESLHEAGGLAIEAVRALQIAHSLRQAAQERTTKAKNAASARHSPREALLDRAIEIARSRPFQSKKAAAEAVINDIPKDEKGTPYDVGTVMNWFRERGFTPPKVAKKRGSSPPGT